MAEGRGIATTIIVHAFDRHGAGGTPFIEGSGGKEYSPHLARHIIKEVEEYSYIRFQKSPNYYKM